MNKYYQAYIGVGWYRNPKKCLENIGYWEKVNIGHPYLHSVTDVALHWDDDDSSGPPAPYDSETAINSWLMMLLRLPQLVGLLLWQVIYTN